MKEYISVTDTAKLIRAALKESFPGIKFSVRSDKYSGGASIDISWEDGPNKAQVDAVAGMFSGANFDSMQDLLTYVSTQFDGKETHFCADYVFGHRTYSDSFLQRCIDSLWEEYRPGIDKPTAAMQKNGECWYLKPDCFGNNNAQDMIWRKAQKRSTVIARPSKTMERFYKPSKGIEFRKAE